MNFDSIVGQAKKDTSTSITSSSDKQKGANEGYYEWISCHMTFPMGVANDLLSIQFLLDRSVWNIVETGEAKNSVFHFGVPRK